MSDNKNTLCGNGKVVCLFAVSMGSSMLSMAYMIQQKESKLFRRMSIVAMGASSLSLWWCLNKVNIV
jgi:hypothetical protein